MYHFYPEKTETVRALKEIILTIVETNLSEMPNIEPHRQYMEEVLSSFQRKVILTNGIYVEMENSLIYIQLTVNVRSVDMFMNDIQELQKRIYEEVKDIIGFNVSSINIKVKYLIDE
ncbi:Asp23/Gls24 family envelope stress response protein [Neobacillus sp. D3-1R]|uniref:Asp23/Gls24 family envelope stress response protein n=1 Tax=Neobacillus sp. D3-1R TaxID=3445778 RepID=UPI003F9F9B0C